MKRAAFLAPYTAVFTHLGWIAIQHFYLHAPLGVFFYSLAVTIGFALLGITRGPE
jgi:hypothetical protein